MRCTPCLVCLFALCAIVAISVGCSKSPVFPEEDASISIRLVFPEYANLQPRRLSKPVRAAKNPIVTVTVTIQNKTQDFPVIGNTVTGTIGGLQPGSTTITAELKDAESTTLWGGSSPVTLAAGQTAEVTISLNRRNDIPPAPDFSIAPLSGDTGTLFTFDASDCSDIHDDAAVLQVRWDWESDGIWDTEYATMKKTTHLYIFPGNYEITLMVKDLTDHESTRTQQISVDLPGPPQSRPF